MGQSSFLPPANDTVFYMEKYIKLVDDLLDSMEATGTLAGYQCVINKDGVKNYSRAGGFSIHETDNDGVRVDMTTDRRHNVASLSKYITTILLAMVLEEHSIPFDTAIVSYLPSTWTDVDEPSIHPNHITPGNPCEITFEKLVTHRTCLDFEGGTENNACSNGVIPDCNAGFYYLTDDLLARLALPEDLTCCGQNDYQNANFELARVLITHIVYPDLDEEAANYNDISVLLYHSLLNQMIYQPLGIDAPWGEIALQEYHQTEPIRAYQYPFIPTNTTLTEDSSACHGILGAWLTSNWDRNAGGSGLVLSTEDYAKIIRTFIHTEILVSDSVKNYVIDNFLGLSLNEQTFGITPFGTFRNKNGRRGATCNGRAYSTSLFIYPNGLETVVFFNSNTRTINGQGIPIGPQGIIRDAWASSWKRDCNAFKHVTREGSLAGNWTAIDDPRTNGDPSKLLFITEELTSSNNSSSPQGVWYTNFGNWAIFNQDGATMNIAQRFNVLVIDEDNPNAFKHTAQLNNLTGAGLSRTIITHPELNNNPDAHIMITQNWQSTPVVYNVHPVGVFYDSSSGYWQIYNS
ncbi:MAG: serine hydrolase, partial [Flavobacteriales bacterium]|nr:serine hydrolase [Flavobacteriales bacterium]